LLGPLALLALLELGKLIDRGVSRHPDLGLLPPPGGRG
jgi:hypothetical protein